MTEPPVPDAHGTAKFAVVADVHANLFALDAVLADVARRGISRVWSLGDEVGYSTLPRETLRRLEERGIEGVVGNHDLMALGRLEPTRCGPQARAAILWTRGVLGDADRARLLALPGHRLAAPDAILLHSCLGDPVVRMREPADFLAQREALLRFDPGIRLCFTGHTHVAQVTEVDAGGRVTFHDADEIVLSPSSFYFVNPGSVGHPRKSDYRARYGIYDAERLTVVLPRVPYDRDAMRRENARHGIFTELGPGIALHRARRAVETLRSCFGGGHGR